MNRFWKILGVMALLLCIAVLLVFFTASSWLETPAGRTLLQRELGKSLGVRAQLEGEYALELFPGLRISGQQMMLSDIASARVMASLSSYQLHLALWPLLSKQVIIHKVSASDGFFDLDLLLGQSNNLSPGSNQPSSLPTIRSLELNSLRVVKSSADLLAIDYLLLEDFEANQDAQLELRLSMPGDKPGTSLVEMSGSLLLVPEPLDITLDIDDASVRISNQAFPVGKGRLSWSQDTGEFSGEINGMLLDYSSEMDFRLATVPGTTATMRLKLLSPDQHLITADVTASDVAGLWILRPFQLVLDGQPVAGEGCLSLDGKPRFQLVLAAADLDFDKLETMLPGSLMEAGPGAQPVSAELPFDMAVELKIGSATMSGAVATDVHLQLGQTPDCYGKSQPDSR